MAENENKTTTCCYPNCTAATNGRMSIWVPEPSPQPAPVADVVKTSPLKAIGAARKVMPKVEQDKWNAKAKGEIEAPKAAPVVSPPVNAEEDEDEDEDL